MARRAAGVLHEWAGLPIPIDGEALRIARGHPLRHLFEEDRIRRCGADDVDETEEIVNEWHSLATNSHVIVYRKNGRAKVARFPDPETVSRRRAELHALGCVQAWLPEAEAAALETLRAVVSEWQFRCYTMAGAFIESSERSGVSYIFRRLRPTLAIRPDREGKEMRVLAALCLHPIGYYDRTFAGAMVPTDDVLAHLLLMRGAEAKFWARANQHPNWRGESG